ncbi:MAG TPA: acetolactate synthase [Oscillospiraceae bacterium]|nr:acetolactate synthase [Oscillospiraceae bacterium]HPF55959.1 acetolactate synthase [Clostridiales bacterium]HPK35205.1 acetolactate synthase [Oscillospiraceae bacterium]HPR75008.1 acetolactate synthase [Oscillospiraceae bacterium]
MLKQLSVFLENKAGSVCEVAELLQKKNIDVVALCIADTAKFGILRMVVSDPDAAVELLRGQGHTVSLTDVLIVGIENKPGGMLPVLRVLNEAGVGIEYMYAFVGKTKDAFMVLRVENPGTVADILTAKGITCADQSIIG